MANQQNEHIRVSHLKLYQALEFLFEKNITVLSTRCLGVFPIVRVQPLNTAGLEGCVVKNRIVGGVRVNEYNAIQNGCLIVWENINVH